MKLEVNEMEFDICVPVDSVMGEPEIDAGIRGPSGCRGTSISDKTVVKTEKTWYINCCAEGHSINVSVAQQDRATAS